MFYVFDLDGTLADMEFRRHFVSNGNNDWKSFYKSCVEDRPNTPVIEALNAHLKAGHRVEIWSGRSDEVEVKTREWLSAHGVDQSLLKHMRPQNNYMPDDQLKKAWLEACDVKPDAVYDDRDKVVAMWRAEGIACFQVAPGNF